MQNPHDVDVISPDTICVCDGDTYTVKVVDVTHDVVAATLLRPEEVSMNGTGPMRLAVLGHCIMVMYSSILTIYHYDSIEPVEIIPVPESLNTVSAISTDAQGNFLLTDCETRSVFVVDVKGQILHTVNFDSYSKARDCTLVGRQLWVGCSNGDIVFLSSINTPSTEMAYELPSGGQDHRSLSFSLDLHSDSHLLTTLSMPPSISSLSEIESESD